MITLSKIQNIFNVIIKRYKEVFNFDLSYMKVELSSTPRYTNGKPSNMPSNQYGGCWTNQKIIYINPDPESVLKYYTKRPKIYKEEIDDFLYLITAHELAHEVLENIVSKEYKEALIDKAISEGFSTVYLEHIHGSVPEDRYRKEVFCEYLAQKVTDNIKV